MTARRVISLISSATETVAALGEMERLVGRSHECDFPASIGSLPVCTAAKIDSTASSLEIDRQVKSLLTDAASIYSVDRELLEQLQPDLIITQTQCAVCAVSLADVEQALCATVSSRPKILAVEPNDLEGIWTSIRQIAEALGVAEKGESLIDGYLRRLRDISRAIPAGRLHPSVACIEWMEPLMAAGNWVPELVEIAGGRNQFGIAGKHSPWMTWDELVASDPDVIVAMPCGWDLARTTAESTTLTSRPEWAELKAVRTGRVALTDGNQFFNRPGPRIVESAEILAEIFFPDDFDFGHQDAAYAFL